MSDDGTNASGAPVLSRCLTIRNRRGLHARAAAKFVSLAERFGADVEVVKDGQSVPARSIMGLMMLGAGHRRVHRVARRGLGCQGSPRGVDRPHRVRLRRAGLSRCPFRERRATSNAPGSWRRAVPPAPPERRLAGIAVSPGIAIGPVFGAAEPRAVVVRQKIAAADIAARDRPAGRRRAAIAQATAKLRARLGVLPEDSQAEIAPLLDAYLQMVGPSRLLRGARRRIDRDAGQRRDRGDGRQRGDRRRHPRHGRRRRRPRRPQAPRRRGARDRPPPACATSPAPRSAALPACRKARCWSARGCARPTPRCSIPRAWPASPPTRAAREGHTAIMLRALGVPAVLGVAGLSAGRRGRATPWSWTAPPARSSLNPSPATLAAARRARRRLRPRAASSWPAAPPARRSRSTARRSSCRPTWKSRPSCR